MTYREPPAAAPVVSRRLVAEDSFRWPKIVLGLVMLVGSLMVLWTSHRDSLSCTNESCVVRQDYVLRPTAEFPFDARRPPAVMVERASIGKNGEGKRLLLRYSGGGDVELARDWGEGVEADATRLRAYLASPKGSFSLEQPSRAFPIGMGAFVALLGLAMLLDGLTLAGWRTIRADGARHVLVIDRKLLGVRVKRESFPITSSTVVGRQQVRAGNPHFFWLTLEQPGTPPQRLPLLDRPRSRAIIEELVARA